MEEMTKIQMRLEVGSCSEISKTNSLLHQGLLPLWDLIFFRVPHGVNAVANELMFLWEGVRVKDLGWRWHECLC